LAQGESPHFLDARADLSEVRLQAMQAGALIAKDVFAHAPRTQRSLPALNRRWSAVRDLRNRVFHHERIIHRGHLQTTHADIVSLLSWMSPTLPMMLSWLDRFPEVLRSGIGPWDRRATTTRSAPR
jgi:hypothetical protein